LDSKIKLKNFLESYKNGNAGPRYSSQGQDKRAQRSPCKNTKREKGWENITKLKNFNNYSFAELMIRREKDFNFGQKHFRDISRR
jgi:hypothetical protein